MHRMQSGGWPYPIGQKLFMTYNQFTGIVSALCFCNCDNDMLYHPIPRQNSAMCGHFYNQFTGVVSALSYTTVIIHQKIKMTCSTIPYHTVLKTLTVQCVGSFIEGDSCVDLVKKDTAHQFTRMIYSALTVLIYSHYNSTKNKQIKKLLSSTKSSESI